MKILYVNNLYAPYLAGGTERTLQSLVEGISARGHEVAVLTTGPDAGINEEFVNGVRVLRVGFSNIYWPYENNEISFWKKALWHFVDIYNPLMKEVVKNIIRLEKPDIVSCHNLPGLSVSAWSAAKEERVRIVHVLHDQYLICPRCTMINNDTICSHQCVQCRCMRTFHPMFSNNVTAVVGVSKFILEHHIKFGYFKKVKIHKVIYNARHYSWALEVPRKSISGLIRFGFIGLLNNIKGIELLLNAYCQVAQKGWELHIAGSGKVNYETYLRNNYNRNDIIFHGVQKPIDFYQNIDILVVPSICNDNLPGVVIEGLSFGIPVIGARRGGIPEMVIDGINGILFDPINIEDLKQAMLKLAIDYGLMTKLSSMTRDTVINFIDTNRFLSLYEDLYQELCEAKNL